MKWKRTMLPVFSAMLTFVLILNACSNGNGNSSGNGTSSTETNAQPSSANTEMKKELKTEEGAKLVVWETKDQLEFVKEVGKKFEEQYGVPVTVKEVGADKEQSDRLATDGPAGLAADILTLPHDHIGLNAKAGLILPNDYFEEETRTSSTESAVTASTFEGVLYGYPKAVETYALLYNKDLVPSPPTTWEDIIEFSKTFNDPTNNKYTIMWDLGSFYYSYIFYSSLGGYIFGKEDTDTSDIGLNNDGAIKGLTYFKKLKSALPLNSGDITGDVKSQLFQQGKLAFNIDGPWAISSFRDKVNFGVVSLPKFPSGEQSISFSGVKSYCVNAYSKYPNAARLFAHFATSKENQLLDYKMTGIIPANSEAAEDPIIQQDPYISGFYQQFTHSNPMPSIPEFDYVWEPTDGALVSIWNNDADPKTTLDTAVETIKQKLQLKK
ncbi:ABC transporter substrate-binding protein [Paenibacillus beijingensis]|uniref:Maltodextrin-binding protein n=2 Tax=Paenibacillus beijingensis TaxID=1126833 RepID=A0A0D5NRN0_9BACL|nr:ABC transporter substrate-binding protein [Paenibacillus beijingensis]